LMKSFCLRSWRFEIYHKNLGKFSNLCEVVDS
jgi:hypothetical protein